MYLVTGGQYWNALNVEYLSSTEVLTKGGDSWSYVGELPRAMTGLRAVSIDNTVITAGR